MSEVSRAEFEGLRETVDTLRISREARLQKIEYHLERLVTLIDHFMQVAPWLIGLWAVTQILTLWVGIEGWRRP
jgi:hypothetical protein